MKSEALAQILRQIIFYLFAFLLFFTPLIYTSLTKEYFEFPKMFLVYLVGVVIVAAFLLLYVYFPFKLVFPKKEMLLWFLANVISTVFSSHPYTSFFGYYSRFNEGLLSTLIFLLLYFVAKNTFDKKDFENLLFIIFLSLVPVSVFGILQHLQGEARVYSTFGQPNWLAQYLVMCLPLFLYKYISHSSFWRIATFYSLVFSCLWFTYSLSGLLGFMAGMLVLFYLLPKTKKINLRLGVLAFISLVIVLSNFTYFGARVGDALIDLKKFVQAQTIVYAQSDAYKVSDPGAIRRGIWAGSLQYLFSSYKNFFLGSGPETFPYNFQEFRPSILNYSSEWDFVLNKPHNYYVEILTELGLLGLLTYLFLIVKSLQKCPASLFPTLVGFLVTNFFGWPVVPTTLLFWFFLSQSLD